jgi:hypothetical protein
VQSRSPSAFWRRGLAALAGACFPLAALLAVAEPSRSWAGVLLIAGIGAPYLAMIVHLNLTHELSPEEKAAWRRELWWGHRSLVGVWMYLLATDLRSTSRDIAATGREWWRP